MTGGLTQPKLPQHAEIAQDHGCEHLGMTAGASASDIERAGRVLRMAGMVSVALVLAAFIGAVQAPLAWPLWLTAKLVAMQDIWLAAIICLGAVAAMVASKWKLGPLELRPSGVALFALAVFALCMAGHYLVLEGYDLTRDEQMVRFDAWVFAHGRLVWPLPDAWQGEAKALNLMFMHPVDHPSAWISNYLPGNALLHTLAGLAGNPAVTAPLLTSLSLPLVWSCARRIWPDNSEAATVSVVLLALSGQLLFNGMTLYAMASHLFFNLAWLRLFLADRRRCDVAAVAIGGFATGLHQPLFHPMFVAPFMLLILLERRWRRLAFFAVAYVAIGVFWLAWPVWMQALVVGPLSHGPGGGSDFAARLREVLAVNSGNLTLTCANLLRFVTWQHALLLPLVLAAVPVVRRDRLAGALALGLILPIAVMAVILPWQGNGFGYRYLHPVLGNAALLGGYGWLNLAPLHRTLRGSFVVASGATLCVLLPAQLMMSHARYEPYARASAVIDASGADYAILQTGNGISYGSVVFNRPDLSNRPIRLQAEAIEDPKRLATRICRPGVVVALAGNGFFRPGSAYFGEPSPETADNRLPALRAPFEAAGCTIRILG